MINVSDNVREVLGFTARLSDQYHFAVAKALTDTVKAAALAEGKEVDRAFEGATPFTRNAFFITPARKDNLTASVRVKDKQAEYLAFQVEGGTRQPKRQALRLPAVVQLDAFGNVPAGLIRQLVSRAKQGKRATKGQARRFGVSQALSLFYGEPGDGRPAGIYKRVVINSERHQLVPVIVFPKQPAHYDKRLDFYGKAKRAVLDTFEPALVRAWQKAKATAR